MGFRVATPELSTNEKVALMDLDGLNVRLLIEPMDYEVVDKVKVKAELKSKSPSERQRAVLFLLWKQEGQQGLFEAYYAQKMEKNIEWLKLQLEEKE